MLTQVMPTAFCLALPRAGSNMLARMAMIAITTSSSISVKDTYRKECLPFLPETGSILLFPRLRNSRRSGLLLFSFSDDPQSFIASSSLFFLFSCFSLIPQCSV